MTTTICFAGVNTKALATATEGRAVLVSFADYVRRPGVFSREVLPRLEAGDYGFAILDSGAFTVISSNITIDVEAYGEFVAEYGHLFDVVVNLDDIAGDVETTLANQRQLERYAPPGVAILPVFHQGEPWELLADYVDAYGYVGVGFARKPGGRLATGLAERRAFLDDFFARVPAAVKVHGFAMTRHAREGYPFASVDSTTWINEGCALRKRDQGATHAAWGSIGAALDKLDRVEQMRVALDSYQFTGTERWSSEAKGQAATVLARFGPEMSWARLALGMGRAHFRDGCRGLGELEPAH